MVLPEKLLQSLENVQGFNRKPFEEVHASDERVFSVRINPGKYSGTALFPNMEPVPWTDYGFYLKTRPSYIFDPRLHAGAYYVQEASGMILEQAFKQLVPLQQSLKVLDLCAAPGGKSTHIQSLLNDNSILVSNEVIKSRVVVLEENTIKWGSYNTIVTNNDPRNFSSLTGFFDVIVMDAPCSGSGLFRREPELIKEWSPENVLLCSKRQERIIKDILPALAENGILIYATCSYSKEENENIADFLTENCGLENLPLNIPSQWNIIESIADKGAKGYRFFPDKIKGEGFYMACFKKNNAAFYSNKRRKPANNKNELNASAYKETGSYIKLSDNIRVSMFNNRLLAQNILMKEVLPELQQALYIRKAGVSIGKILSKGLIPDHELAVSTVLSAQVVDIPLNLEQSVQYLRKDTVTLSDKTEGWATVSYENYKLGWVKIFGERMNNYYPSDWRILKREM